MKKSIVYLSCIFLCCLLFVHSASAVSAGLQGFYIWRNTLLPALLPFFVCAYMMQHMGLPAPIEKYALIILCFISGAPSGARLLSENPNADTRAVAIFNTVSPMFIYASFCSGMLECPILAAPILISQFLTVIILLFIFRPNYTFPNNPCDSPLKLLGEGISSSIQAMLNICAALVFFMATAAAADDLFSLPSGVIGAIISGMLEMTSGCIELSRLNISARTTAAVAAFVFSFGGVCIFAQSLTLCSLNAAKYFSTKLLQGCISAMLTWLITPLFPISQAVFNSITPAALASNAWSFLLSSGVSLTAIAAVFMIGSAARYRKYYSRKT